LAWYGKKTKPNTTKAHIHKSKDMYYNTENKHKNLWNLIAARVNGAGLFSKEKISKGG